MVLVEFGDVRGFKGTEREDTKVALDQPDHSNCRTKRFILWRSIGEGSIEMDWKGV